MYTGFTVQTISPLLTTWRCDMVWSEWNTWHTCSSGDLNCAITSCKLQVYWLLYSNPTTSPLQVALEGETVWAVIHYGFIASVYPCWWCLYTAGRVCVGCGSHDTTQGLSVATIPDEIIVNYQWRINKGGFFESIKIMLLAQWCLFCLLYFVVHIYSSLSTDGNRKYSN